MATVDNQTRGGLDGDLDARLLGDKQEDELDRENRSGDLRAAKRAGNKPEPGYLNEEPKSLRQAVLRAKVEKRIKEQKSGKAGIIKKVNAIRKMTSGLLRAAWINIITSFGLTTFYIDAHVFLNQVFGDKVFCNLGEEWTDATGANMSDTAAGNAVKNSAGTVERAGCCCLNLGCLIIFFAIFGIIALIMKFYESPVDFILGLIGFAWDAAKQAIIRITS